VNITKSSLKKHLLDCGRLKKTPSNDKLLDGF